MNASIANDRGELKISINGRLYPPLSFKSFRPNPRNVSEFYAAGVRLYTVLSSGIISALGIPYSLFGESWVGDGKYDFAPVDRQMDMFIENAPDGYFAPMVQLDTRPWYLEENPGTPNSFTNLSQIAGDEKFRSDASEYLKAFLRHCEEKYGDRIWGYFMLGGTTTEWFSDRDYEASHPMKEKAYKKWLASNGFPEEALPTPEQLNRKDGIFLGADEENVERARRFHAELISDLILRFAGEAQSVIRHQKLLGLYYGYLFELGGERLHNAGHLAYEKVFYSPDIDMISSPSSYGFRSQTDPSAFMVPQKSLYAHEKLYFLEFDHRTHTIPEKIQEPLTDQNGNRLYVTFPGAENKCANETESLNLMYRDFVFSQSNGAALWWFDMLDGWFRSDGMMNAVSRMLGIDRELSGYDKGSAAEIAVFAEGESMYHVRKASPIATGCLSAIRRTLAETGAPYDLYSIADIALTDVGRYKFFIFVNQYDISEKELGFIRERCMRAGKTVLWLLAPDYAKNNGCDASRIGRITGINVADGAISHGSLVFDGEKYPGPASAPYFEIDDPGAKPTARFEDGKTAVAETSENGYRSVYSAAYNLPSALLRKLAYESGVFVYSDNPRVYTYANKAFLGVYNASGSDAEINVKAGGIYRDLIIGGEFRAENGRLTLPERDIHAYLLIRK